MEVQMKSLSLIILIAAALVVVGCESGSTVDNPVSSQNQVGKFLVSSDNNMAKPGSETLIELARVRSATAMYHKPDNALKNDYVDINEYVEHMGWHYLKMDLLDGTFDMEKPELLVYAPKSNGSLQLVAVEYAMSHDLSPDPPEGFTGNEDVWEYNEEFDLWTLHAWVWYPNPDGMFNPTNPRVD
jgi:hypothetical protein